MIRLVSVSGGKDSTATLLLAMERHPQDEIRAAFADTGNEHESTYAYIDYLQRITGVPIHRVKADFSGLWPGRIAYVRDKWPEKFRDPKPKLLNKGAVDNEGAAPVYQYFEPMPEPEIEKIVASALAVLEQGPTGNPFLDLCILKARFPSRMAQFCTQELKVYPLTEYMLSLIDEHGPLESWQGVRADESPRRAALAEREDVGGGLVIYRPIHQWSVAEVFAMHKKYGVDPNPLYKLGMSRVGCMPCVNCSKPELLEISKRFPGHIDRIEAWEKIVCKVSKRENATFFPAPGDNDTAYARGNIRCMVEWSKTKRGGTKYDIFSMFEEPAGCSSAYGLCE